ncbi:hypothetical protein [Colwellia sp. 12G3]|uniref:COG4648 family protein n=1 Tax=Colwellia sp. 12G3 TaxID=2058299 RepID=UPI000C339966|nr:hypothetical protein [Colwellia sp. 12G3]PKI13860.1 hypothetical protein CXF71_14790 [Colwellia sp. 12G3]
MKNALLALLLITYPVAVYFGLQYIEPGILAAFFAILFIVRHLNSPGKRVTIPHANIVLVTVLSLLTFSMVANSALALKFYPVVMSLSFLAIFGYSLYKPPSVVEIIARLREELDEHGVAYTRRVTQVWCGFFILNALIATGTIFHENEQVWLVYNGLISYVLMGLLMAGEFGVRFVVTKRNLANKTSKSIDRCK